MNSLRVLIVEDESIVAMEIESYLEHLDYKVIDICSNSIDALHVAQEEKPDIILMDICLKGDTDGIETAEAILKQHPKTQLIFLTAHMDDYNVDRAIALNPVAYLSKPFNQEELRVALKIASIKRNGDSSPQKRRASQTHIHLDQEFCYDTQYQILYCCNEPIHLTRKESELLSFLMENKNQILSPYSIEMHLWSDRQPHPNTLRTLIKRVREKLKNKFIKTLPGQGYRLTIPPLRHHNLAGNI